MRAAHREKLANWITWYRENRPRHEGQADVHRTLAFQGKALEGIFSLLIIIAEDERPANGLITIPGLERR